MIEKTPRFNGCNGYYTHCDIIGSEGFLIVHVAWLFCSLYEQPEKQNGIKDPVWKKQDDYKMVILSYRPLLKYRTDGGLLWYFSSNSFHFCGSLVLILVTGIDDCCG